MLQNPNLLPSDMETIAWILYLHRRLCPETPSLQEHPDRRDMPNKFNRDTGLSPCLHLHTPPIISPTIHTPSTQQLPNTPTLRFTMHQTQRLTSRSFLLGPGTGTSQIRLTRSLPLLSNQRKELLLILATYLAPDTTPRTRLQAKSLSVIYYHGAPIPQVTDQTLTLA